MSSVIKVGKVQSSTGQDAVTVADSGAITANGALTASGGIANAGTISAGTINSSVVIQQKTAVITGEHSADLNVVADNSGKTLHTFPLNTELDPYNFVTLSSNEVTVTEAGTYDISWHSGSVLAWEETGSGTYMQTYLEIGGTDTKKGSTTYVLDHIDRAGNAGTPTNSKGNWVGTLSANDTLKIRAKTSAMTYGLRSWTGFTGSGNNNVYSHMLIQKIG